MESRIKEDRGGKWKWRGEMHNFEVDDIVRIKPPLDEGLPYEFWQITRFRENGLVLIIPARKDGRPCSLGQVARYMTWTKPANLRLAG